MKTVTISNIELLSQDKAKVFIDILEKGKVRTITIEIEIDWLLGDDAVSLIAGEVKKYLTIEYDIRSLIGEQFQLQNKAFG